MINEFVQFIQFVKSNLIRNERFYLSGTLNELRIAKSLSDPLFIFRDDFSVSVLHNNEEIYLCENIDLEKMKQFFEILFL